MYIYSRQIEQNQMDRVSSRDEGGILSHQPLIVACEKQYT